MTGFERSVLDAMDNSLKDHRDRAILLIGFAVVERVTDCADERFDTLRPVSIRDQRCYA